MAKAKTLRVHSLAKQLGVTSKQVIEKCCAEGIELKNHMAAISLGLAESIQEWFTVGEDETSVEVAERIDLSAVRKTAERTAKRATSEAGQTAVAEMPAELVEEPVEEPGEQALPAAAVAVVEPSEVASPPAETEAEAAASAELTPATETELAPAAQVIEEEEEAQPVAPPPETDEAAAVVEVEEPTAEEEGPPDVTEPGTKSVIAAPPPPEPISPAGPQLVPEPAELQGPRVIRIEAPEPVRPLRVRPPVQRPAAQSRETGTDGGAATTTSPARGGRGRGRTGRGEESESQRLRSRSPRRQGRTADVGERLREWRDQDLIERRERLASATGHGLKDRRAAEQRRRAVQAASMMPAGRKAPVEITTPIALKDFCAAIGTPFAIVSRKLIEHTGQLWTINQSLDAEIAELLAIDLGVPVTVVKEKTALERLREEFEQRQRPNLAPRPPVVAMLGHVDHGKTSLLDAIRQTNVVEGEAGGITQHIGAYRVERDGWRVTFLDTPGHEAFTAMRARGANLTDVVVLVVAADDGVMPQTVEALNHARAAGVQIVVALNKIDLPNADINRVYAQLAEHELTPREWGGETDVIKTSAVTGEGIDDLIAHLSTLSELMDLKADLTIPAQATVIEARMREGRGVAALVLVREGTLEPGQVIVCGTGAGRVRALRDDRGRTVKEALSGWPVEVSGLDELPATGDHLFTVSDLKQAKMIAEEMRHQRREESLEDVRKPRTLEDLLTGGDESQLPELNVIIRADVRGSADVLKKALEGFPREKAHLRTLLAAVGTVTEADVNLARASDAIIIAFNVVPEDHARQLAEQLGVEIRQYRVIYEILDDMHKALAGLLEPLRREEVRGAAEVRQVFNITRLGTVAGCYVSSGTVTRKQKVRLLRDGRVVLKEGTVHSLKRFKEDAREVRTGFECGIKLDGFDDVKPGDIIETYEIVEEFQEL